MNTKKEIIQMLISNINSQYKEDSRLSQSVAKGLEKLSINTLDQLTVLISTRIGKDDRLK